jgi:hypothetical protein
VTGVWHFLKRRILVRMGRGSHIHSRRAGYGCICRSNLSWLWKSSALLCCSRQCLNQNMMKSINLYLPHIFEVLDWFNVNPTVLLVSGKQLWLKIHQAKLSIPILIHYNLFQHVYDAKNIGIKV